MTLQNRLAMLLLLALSLSFAFGSLMYAADTNRDQPAKASNTEWSKKMRGLYATLTEILTDTSSDRHFNDPGHFAKIEANAKKLAALSNEMKDKKVKSPDVDPSIEILSGLFSQEAKRAYMQLKRGNRDYARALLKGVTGYCVTCHTRNSSGPSIKQLPLEPGPGLIDSFERGQFYAASRQFDRAQEEFGKVIQDHKFAGSQPLAWERAVHQGLNIAIRIKQSPAQAMEIVNTVIETKETPYFLRQNAIKWKTAIEQWQEEPQRAPKTEEGLYAEATRLAAKAHEMQKYPMDRAGDIYYFRSSAVTHDLLQLAPKGSRLPEALLLAGIAYEVLSPLKLDDIHELYYGACIERSPHSPVAELCYQRYQESVYKGYTGSGGSDLPNDVKDQLNRLEELAKPKELNPKEIKVAP